MLTINLFLDSADGRIHPTENSESFSFYLPRDKKLEKGAKLEVSPYSQVRKKIYFHPRHYLH